MDLQRLETIEETENVWITLGDGCRLAARIWKPRDAEARPVPAILEYLPYRKRDFMRARDEPMHRYFAAHGFASLRVDIRGTGDSDGLIHDEYTHQELDDALEVIAWIAAQPWCSGAVGMMGISWGGINSLQVAARRPPALKAIITVCSTDDRYTDDAHYMGGCLLNENMQWGSILTLYLAMPPDPEIVGDRWRKMWRERIEAVDALPAIWMRHQHRDGFWRHGSVCEDYDSIAVPVFAVGGWADGYSNTIPRLLENLKGPCKGLIGPWAHVFPQDGIPGPPIGFLQEAIAWWRQWLADEETGVTAWPALRVWMQDSVPPAPQYRERPGRWVAETRWPSPRIVPRTWFLGTGMLCSHRQHRSVLSFSSPQTTGVRAGEWCAFGSDGEMPRDQRPDDGGSLVFDTDPLEERLEILGAPTVTLRLASDQPVAQLAVRLCDIAPDGAVLRVTYGLLNLTHRHGSDAPEPLAPGAWVEVGVALNDIAHAFPPGHRIRLAISSVYWPIAWPAPRAAVISVDVAGSSLSLPVRPPADSDETLPDFAPPDAAPGTSHKKLRNLPMRRTIEMDLTTNEMVYTLRSDGGEFDGASLARIEDIALDLGYTMLKRYRINEADPLSAETEFAQSLVMRREGWSVRMECRTRLTATAEHFRFSGDLEAFADGAPFAERAWSLTVPRNLV